MCVICIDIERERERERQRERERERETERETERERERQRERERYIYISHLDTARDSFLHQRRKCICAFGCEGSALTALAGWCLAVLGRHCCNPEGSPRIPHAPSSYLDSSPSPLFSPHPPSLPFTIAISRVSVESKSKFNTTVTAFTLPYNTIHLDQSHIILL